MRSRRYNGMIVAPSEHPSSFLFCEKDMEKIVEKLFVEDPYYSTLLKALLVVNTKDCFDDLFTFIDNGYVEISNNIAEQAVKPFVIQRKVFQTSGSYAGARYSSKLFSLVQTCKINNVNVERYFKYVLENINSKDIEDLLPYSEKISKELK